jgi:hypothetical protein
MDSAWLSDMAAPAAVKRARRPSFAGRALGRLVVLLRAVLEHPAFAGKAFEQPAVRACKGPPAKWAGPMTDQLAPLLVGAPDGCKRIATGSEVEIECVYSLSYRMGICTPASSHATALQVKESELFPKLINFWNGACRHNRAENSKGSGESLIRA